MATAPTFFEEMAELVRELLGPGSDFGEQLTVIRPVGGYDAATRRATPGTPLEQPLWGTFDQPGAQGDQLTAVIDGEGLKEAHDRVLTAVPEVASGFMPGVNDRVVGEGRIYVVTETAHVVKQGLPIAWVCGLKTS